MNDYFFVVSLVQPFLHRLVLAVDVLVDRAGITFHKVSHFLDSFWVGMAERKDETGYRAARVVFGSEPTDAEVYQFILGHYDQVQFGSPIQSQQIVRKRMKSRRAQREARKSQQVEGVAPRCCLRFVPARCILAPETLTMNYSFDNVPNRRNPARRNKWNWYPKDVLPMWVADMDFPAPKPILDALHKAVDHGVLGYELPSDALLETVAGRMDALYGWKVKPEMVIAITGIVSAFNAAARAFCSPKRGVLIQTPVYNEFHEIKNNLGVPQLEAPLTQRVDGNILHYEIDWKIFERQVKKAGMFLLCNPHNPLGIVFPRKDLLRMAGICIENDVVIVSDEIHSEILLGEQKFTPVAKLSKEIAQHTITLVAPSKTFNVPGLFCGFAILPNPDLRQRFTKVVDHLRLHVSSLGQFAARTAFSGQADGWLNQLHRYLTGNRDFLVDYVTENLSGVCTTIPTATYLGWLDFTESVHAGRIPGSPFKFFLEEAKVAFSDGKIFGAGYENFVRINFGCPRSTLEDGLERVRKSLR